MKGVASVSAWCAVLLLAGFFIGVIVEDVPYMQLEKEVDPMAAAALLTTIALSALLYRHFERVKFSDQLRKQALLDRLSQSFKSLEGLEEVLDQDSISYTATVSAVTRCRREFNDYIEYAKAFDSPPDEGSAQRFIVVCADLRNLLTNSPPKADISSDIVIVDNIIQIHPNRAVEVKNRLNEGRTLLYEIQRQIILAV